MILAVRIVIDGGLLVPLSIKELGHDVRNLLEVPFAVGRGVVSTRQAGLDLSSVGRVVSP